MFLVKAGTSIQVEIPKSKRWYHNWLSWKPYTTKEDKLYDKEEVWDAVTVHNGMIEIPEWARRNIVEHGYAILNRAGKFAMVRPANIEFLD
tara:strand:+ start:3646 stop:3918 length:273 start_codon:yes stop_codon:yes gene_type:complete